LIHALTVATNRHNRVTLHHTNQRINTNIHVMYPNNLNEFASNYGRYVLKI